MRRFDLEFRSERNGRTISLQRDGACPSSQMMQVGSWSVREWRVTPCQASGTAQAPAPRGGGTTGV